MGCVLNSRCCEEEEIKQTTPNALFISTPLGSHIQVHFHNDERNFTLLLSVECSVHFGNDLQSVFLSISHYLQSNTLVFLTPSDRYSNFTDYESSLWFLSSCPKRFAHNLVIYAYEPEVKQCVVACERHTNIAGLVLNLVGCEVHKVTNVVDIVVRKDETLCPILLIHSLPTFPDPLADAYLNGSRSRELRQVPSPCQPGLLISILKEFMETLPSY